ncbi:MAG: Sua5/YciO/YrdC/YwlC family protein [Collinsella sp.]
MVELRRRKRRSNKPLAVMVRSLADTERLCHVDDAERGLLTGSIRPIVLLRRRAVGEEIPRRPYTRAIRRARFTEARRHAPLHPASTFTARRGRVA